MRCLKLLVPAALAAAATTASAQADPEAAIKYRQALMKAHSGHLGAMFQIASGKAGQPEHMRAHAQSLLETSMMVKSAFDLKTEGGKTRAKPAIWENFDDFSAKADDLVNAAEAVAGAVDSGGDVMEKLNAAGEACKGCHEEYREEE